MKILLFLFAIFTLGHVQASDLDFVLVNATGRTFEALYVTNQDNKDWDGNLLSDGKVLPAGGKITVKFSSTAKDPTWDINVVDEGSIAVRFDAIKLAGVDKITLKETNGKVTAEVE